MSVKCTLNVWQYLTSFLGFTMFYGGIQSSLIAQDFARISCQVAFGYLATAIWSWTFPLLLTHSWVNHPFACSLNLFLNQSQNYRGANNLRRVNDSILEPENIQLCVCFLIPFRPELLHLNKFMNVVFLTFMLQFPENSLKITVSDIFFLFLINIWWTTTHPTVLVVSENRAWRITATAAAAAVFL